jgi:hypothetical protein
MKVRTGSTVTHKQTAWPPSMRGDHFWFGAFAVPYPRAYYPTKIKV